MKFEYLDSIKKDLWQYLKDTSKIIIMYGTGNGADKIIDVFNDFGISLYGIFASDDFARGQIFRGYTVKKYQDFKNEPDEFIVVLSFATQRKEVLENIERIASENELYAPDVPVFGSGLWTKEYYIKKRNELFEIYNRLSDDISRNTFVNTIAYKLTGNINHLKSCETTNEEAFLLVNKYSNNLNFIDVGAYTGDTIEEYTNRYGKNMVLYALEPDERNFRKMRERFLRTGINCKAYNAAAWCENKTLEFDARTGRSCSTDISNYTKSSKIKQVTAIKVDDIVEDTIGFIKIDAEGADVEVIQGMARTIKEYKPVLKVASYHRTDDYLTIPHEVNSICGEYKLFMRHLPYIPAWDTDYYFVFK